MYILLTSLVEFNNPQVPENLVFGTKEANGAMLRAEVAISTLLSACPRRRYGRMPPLTRRVLSQSTSSALQTT